MPIIGKGETRGKRVVAWVWVSSIGLLRCNCRSKRTQSNWTLPLNTLPPETALAINVEIALHSRPTVVSVDIVSSYAYTSWINSDMLPIYTIAAKCHDREPCLCSKYILNSVIPHLELIKSLNNVLPPSKILALYVMMSSSEYFQAILSLSDDWAYRLAGPKLESRSPSLANRAAIGRCHSYQEAPALLWGSPTGPTWSNDCIYMFCGSLGRGRF